MKYSVLIYLLFLLIIATGCTNNLEHQEQVYAEDIGELEQKELHCYFFFIADCPASRNNMPKMEQLNKTYASYGLQIKGIVSDPVLNESELKEALEDFPMDFEIIKDDSLKITKKHHATVTPEVLLYDKDDNLLYSGAVDNYYFKLSRHRKLITEKYLENAILNTLQNKPVTTKETKPIGCRINLKFFDN
jgi:hypothetical protein